MLFKLVGTIPRELIPFILVGVLLPLMGWEEAIFIWRILLSILLAQIAIGIMLNAVLWVAQRLSKSDKNAE